MNRHANEEDRTPARLQSLRTRLVERLGTLGLSCYFQDPGAEAPDGPSDATHLGLISSVAASEPEVIVTDEQGAAGTYFAIVHRTDDLGMLFVIASVYREASIPPTVRLQGAMATIRWAIEDALVFIELSEDIEDLAEQMSDAYETLELMYALGLSMSGIDHPERFVTEMCSRVRETLGFGYVSVHIPDDADVGASLAGKTHSDGTPDEDESDERLTRILSMISSSSGRAELLSGPQAVVRPLRNDTGVVGMIVAGDKTREAGNVSSYDTKLIDAVGGLMSTFLTNTRLYDEQREMAMGVLEALSTAIDAKDPYTRGHAQRVGHLSEQIALAMGYTLADAERLRVAGLLHDVGKIGVSEAVLQKNGRLTDAEFEEIKRHPEIGFRILKDLNGLADVLPAVLHHHERLDGRGYPTGIAGDDIPQIARIVAAADTFDAMSSTRSYRQKMPREDVRAELERCSGTQLDPDVVKALLSIDLTQFDAMIAQSAEADQGSPKAA